MAINTYVNTTKPPRQGPKIKPANITPKVCKVIGTGTQGTGTGGMSPNTIIIAVNSATKTRSFVFNI
jgi:hypothetical protein